MTSPAAIASFLADVRHLQTVVMHPGPVRFAEFRPYRWQPRSLDELRASVGLRPMPTYTWHDYPLDHPKRAELYVAERAAQEPKRKDSEETRKKKSDAARRAWERRKFNPQFVTIMDRQVEIVPLPEPGLTVHEYPPVTVDEWEQQMDADESTLKEKYGIEYTSSGLPIGVTIVRPAHE